MAASKFKRVRRVVQVDCHQCYGRGFVATKLGYVVCTSPGCFHGQVERVVNEFVTDEQEQEGGTA